MPLSQVLDQVVSIAGNVKLNAQRAKAASLAGPVSAADILSFLKTLITCKGQFAGPAATPGLGAYAQGQYADPTLNIAAEYVAMSAQLDATIAWIVANFPTDGTGNLLEKKFDANGNLVFNTFSTESLSGFRAQLDILMSTID